MVDCIQFALHSYILLNKNNEKVSVGLPPLFSCSSTLIFLSFCAEFVLSQRSSFFNFFTSFFSRSFCALSTSRSFRVWFSLPSRSAIITATEDSFLESRLRQNSTLSQSTGIVFFCKGIINLRNRKTVEIRV